MALARVFHLLETASGSAPHFPPTHLYCEGWLTRLVLDWFSSHPASGHPLNFAPEAAWFSEALLPSAFLPRFRGDPLGESRTHADGVVGHFRIGDVGKADFSLAPKATQLLVVEAKLMAPLAAGVGRAGYFDQAARNVACLVEVLKRAGRSAVPRDNLSFCVIAPKAQVAKGSITKLMAPDAITAKVARRVSEYQGAKDEWFSQWFQPAFPFIDLRVLSWEDIIAFIGELDVSAADGLADFYQKSLHYAA